MSLDKPSNDTGSCFVLSDKKPCVALIDDHTQSRLIGKKHLSRDGFNVQDFGSGTLFLEALATLEPDIILLDVMMPEMNGYTVCELVRAQERFKTIPIVMLTGLDDVESISQAYDVGATDFVTKPINWVILQHRIRYMLRSSEVLTRLHSTVDDLNDNRKRLAQAQKIAKLGHWQLDLASGEMFWSEELYRILFAEIVDKAPTLNQFLDMLSSHSRITLNETLNKIDETDPAKTLELQIKWNGQARYLQFECRLDTENKERRLLHGTIQDITDRKATEHEIWRKAYYDSLTLLPNRQYLLETLEAEIYRANARNEQFALVMLDFQRFRNINQTFGHLVGDQLLQSTAQRLETSQRLQQGIFIARIAADQFAIVLSRMKRAEEIEEFIVNLTKILQKPYYHKQYELHTLVNMGVCQYPVDAKNVDELLKHTNVALESSKNQNGKNYLFYNRDLSAASNRRLKIEQLIRTALTNNEFYVVYQPKMNMVTRTITGAEALARWKNPELGNVEPSVFIPIAEETGFINELGNWVLEQACTDVKAWLIHNPDFNLAVNISGQQFYQANFVETVLRALQISEFPAKNLELELTESIIMRDIQSTKAQLGNLLTYGITSSIDDFGTGYSSLNYLKNFPIKKLKIDRSFVTDLAVNADSRAIVKAIIAMSHNLNLQVVAEGVETESQSQFCYENGCDFIQGYLIGKPMPASEFVHLIE